MASTLVKPKSRLVPPVKPYSKVGGTTPMVNALNGVGAQVSTNTSIMRSIDNSLIRQRRAQHTVNVAVHERFKIRLTALRRMNAAKPRPIPTSRFVTRPTPTTGGIAKRSGGLTGITKSGLDLLGAGLMFLGPILSKALSFVLGMKILKWFGKKENSEKFFTALGNFKEWIIDPLFKFLKGFKDWIVENIGDYKGGFAGLLAGIKNGDLAKAFDGLSQIATALAEDLGLSEFINDPLKALGGVWNALKGLFLIKPPPQPKAPPKPKAPPPSGGATPPDAPPASKGKTGSTFDLEQQRRGASATTTPPRASRRAAIMAELETGTLFKRGKVLQKFVHKMFRSRLGLKALGKFMSPIVKRIPIIGTLIDFALNYYLFKEPLGRAAFKAIGAALGGIIGVALGSVIPGFGNAVLGFLGSWGGDWLGGTLYDVFFKGADPKGGIKTISTGRNYGMKDGDRDFFDFNGKEYYAVRKAGGFDFYENGKWWSAGMGHRRIDPNDPEGRAIVNAFIKKKGGTLLPEIQDSGKDESNVLGLVMDPEAPDVDTSSGIVPVPDASVKSAGSLSDVGNPNREIYLHWSAGPKNSTYGGYHTIITGDGKVHRKAPYSDTGRVHTAYRNSRGVGIAVASMAGPNGGPYDWANPIQYEAMAQEVADLAKAWGWGKEKINIKNVMTHAEAGSGKDGRLSLHTPPQAGAKGDPDNHGPKAWGGDGARWDLWHLQKNEQPGSGGPKIRSMIKQRMNKGGVVKKRSLNDGEDFLHKRIAGQEKKKKMNMGGVVRGINAFKNPGPPTILNTRSVMDPGYGGSAVEIVAIQRVVMPIPSPVAAPTPPVSGATPPRP